MKQTQFPSWHISCAMNNKNPVATIKRYTSVKCLLLTALLSLAGCSATLPTIKPESTLSCSTVPDETPIQIAPDDCLKEICIDARLTSAEGLTETAPVKDWAEEAFCFFHPIDCFGALSVKKHVRQWEQDKAKAGFWNHASLKSGLGDAARHAYLACTLTEQFGGTFATGLLNAHEEDSTVKFGFGTGTAGNKCCDKIMDLYNNRIGREMANKPGSCEEKVMQSLHLLRYSLCVK